MDLHDVTRRIFLRHWILIAVCLLVGAGAMFALDARRVDTYTASTRFVLTSPDQSSTTDPQAEADAAEAIVTSPGRVQAALQAAGVDRDPVEFARRNVKVSALGSSDVLQLDVLDIDPQAAAAVARALVENLLQTWVQGVQDQFSTAITTLQARIDGLSARIAKLTREITSLDVEIAASGGADEFLVSQRDALAQSRSDLEQHRLIAQTQMNDLILKQATGGAQPRVIDHATAPLQADPSHSLVDVALGLILGLVVGITLATMRETFQPSVVGSNAIADALDVPVLGELQARPDVASPAASSAGLPEVANRVRLAAAGAGVGGVELFAVGPQVDLSALPGALSGAMVGGSGNEHAGNGRRQGRQGGPAAGGVQPTTSSNDPLAVRTFGADSGSDEDSNGSGRGLVAVLPLIVKQSDLRTVLDLRAVTDWPLLGIITYRRGLGHRSDLGTDAS